MSYRLALNGSYGDFVRERIEGLPKDRVLLDIGANIGLFSILGAKHLTEGRVYAFEPNPAIFAYLQANLAENGCANALGFCVAISEAKPAAMALSWSPLHSGRGSLIPGEVAQLLRVTSMDWAIFDALHEVGARYAVKLDVEGYELPVLRTLARSAMFSSVCEIIVEVSELTTAAEDLEALRAFLTANGFELVARSEGLRHRDELHVRRRLQ